MLDLEWTVNPINYAASIRCGFLSFSYSIGDWVVQQCRNASMGLEDEGLEVQFLLRNRDGKYQSELGSAKRITPSPVLRMRIYPLLTQPQCSVGCNGPIQSIGSY